MKISKHQLPKLLLIVFRFLIVKKLNSIKKENMVFNAKCNWYFSFFYVWNVVREGPKRVGATKERTGVN